jgi:hypothetical protein
MIEDDIAGETQRRTVRALIHAARNPLAAILAALELVKEGASFDATAAEEMHQAAGRLDDALRFMDMVIHGDGEAPWSAFVGVWTCVVRQLWPGVQIELPSLVGDPSVSHAPALGQAVLSAVRLLAGAEERARIRGELIGTDRLRLTLVGAPRFRELVVELDPHPSSGAYSH